MTRPAVAVIPLFLGMYSSAQWTQIATGIPGDLISVAAQNNAVLLLVATSGAYRSSDSGSTWDPCTPQDVDQAAVFARCRFTSVVNSSSHGVFVGRDTVNDRAVIFDHTFASATTALVFTGALGTRLRSVGFGSLFTAVGDDGLMVWATQPAGPWTVRPPFTAQDLTCTSAQNNDILIGGDSCLYLLPGVNADPEVQFTGTLVDVAYYTNGPGTALTAQAVHRRSDVAWPTLTHYYGPIAPTCVDHIGGQAGCFIGTQNGILFGNISSPSVLQWQPSAHGYHVNGIDYLSSGKAWAACDNGVLLATTNDGGDVEPWVTFTAPYGGCTWDQIQFTNEGDNTLDWTWTVDGDEVSDDFHYDQYFTAPDNHTITLTGTSGTNTQDFSITITIVDPPAFSTLPYTATGTLLCHSGESSITVTATSPDYHYRLYRLDDMAALDEATGNGGALTLHSGTLTDSCTLGIAVIPVIAQCVTLMDDSIPVHIEQTRAAFLSGYLNATPGESITLFNTSRQSTAWQWSFGNGASPTNSVNEDPVISYAAAGTTQVTLIATSAEGCTDTLITEGPFIYGPADLDPDCWAFRANTWTGTSSYPDGVNAIGRVAWSAMNDAVYLAGGSDRSRIESRAGRSFETPFPDAGGQFFARYDKSGMLKWVIYGGMSWASPNYGIPFPPLIAACRTSTDLFAISQAPFNYDDDTLRYVDGSFALSPYPYWHDLMRIDDQGRPVWVGHSNMLVRDFAVDSDDNLLLIVVGDNCNGNFDPSWIGPTGAATILPFCGFSSLVKIDPNGALLWAVPIEGALQNNDEIVGLCIDPLDNIILSGNFAYDVQLNSTDGDSLFFDSDDAGQDDRGVLAKYDNNGVLQWGQAIYRMDAERVACDGVGNIYASLFAHTDTTAFPSTNLPNTIVEDAFPMLCSYSAAGDFRWAAVTDHPSHGAEVACAPDGDILLFGDVYKTSGYQRFGRPGQPFLDSIWSSGQVHLASRWNTEGDLLRVTTLASDSCPAYFNINEAYNVQSLRMAVDGDGRIFVGANFRHPDMPAVMIAGSLINGLPDDHYFFVFAELDDALCDSDPDIALPDGPGMSAQEHPDLDVFPVPADVRLNVRVGGQEAVVLTLFDTQGRAIATRLFRPDGPRTVSFDTGALAPGLYTLRGSWNGRTSTRAVVVMH